MARDDLQEGREEGEKQGKWLGGRGKRGREVSTAGKTLRVLTGGEVVQASPSLVYKPDDLLHLHCKNECVILAKYFAIRESVDSLCRDGADAQYLSKSRITLPQIR